MSYLIYADEVIASSNIRQSNRESRPSSKANAIDDESSNYSMSGKEEEEEEGEGEENYETFKERKTSATTGGKRKNCQWCNKKKCEVNSLFVFCFFFLKIFNVIFPFFFSIIFIVNLASIFFIPKIL